MPAKGERYGSYLLDDLTKATGGLHFQVKDRDSLPEVAAKMSQAMTNVYVIGYKPPEQIDGGKWRKIESLYRAKQESHFVWLRGRATVQNSTLRNRQSFDTTGNSL